MDLHLSGKHVLITGGTKGIGFAIADLVAAEGAAVTIVGRDADRLADAKARLAPHGAQVTAIVSDLAEAGARAALAAEAGDVDILVNCAGAIPGGDLFALPIETWQESWQLKVFGYIDLTRLYLERMKARESGTIVNIIGDLGRSPRFDYVCGSTANAALIAFTEAVGAKSPDWNVRVFGVNPTATRTERIVTVARGRAESALGDPERWREMIANRPFGRLSEPEEVARIVAMLASPAAGYLSGTVVDLDGGMRHRG